MKIGFIIINSGKKGGAEKRFFNIMHLLKHKNQIHLLANGSIVEYGEELGFSFEGISVEVLFWDNSKPNQYNSKETGKKKYQPQLITKKIIKKITTRKFRGFLRELYTVLKYNYYILFWAKRNHLDVVNSLQPSGIYTISKVFCRTKTVFSYVDYEVNNGYPFCWVKNMGLKSVFKFSDEYDFLSPMIPQALESKGLKLDRKKINIAPNSIIDFNRIMIGKKDPERIVLSGRMEKVKNPLLALEAVNILKKKRVNFEFYLLGRGSLDKDIKNFIKKNELSNNVHFYFEPNIEKILAHSSIYLSLQDGNNYPSQALLEAMASECAIIATDVGETSMLIDREVGFLVSKDPLHIVEKLIVLITNHEFSRELGQNARKRALKSHNFKKYESYLLNVYNRALYESKDV